MAWASEVHPPIGRLDWSARPADQRPRVCASASRPPPAGRPPSSARMATVRSPQIGGGDLASPLVETIRSAPADPQCRVQRGHPRSHPNAPTPPRAARPTRDAQSNRLLLFEPAHSSQASRISSSDPSRMMAIARFTQLNPICTTHRRDHQCAGSELSIGAHVVRYGGIWVARVTFIG